MTTMAKKRRNNLVFSISIVVILVALLIVVKITGKEDDIETEDYSYKICDISAGQFMTVTYEYSDGTKASYKKEVNTWKNADDSEFPLSSSAFENQFVTTFSGFTSSKKITEYDGDKSKFGFDEPFITVTITTKENKTLKYYLGSYNPSIGEYYLMIDGDDSIYTISTDFEFICRKDIYDYATVDTFPKYNSSTLDYLEFKSGDISVQVLYRPDGLEEDFIGNTTWYIASPFGRIRPCEDSRMDTLADEIMEGLVYSKTVNYKATKEELSDYGLSTPVGSYSIHYTYKDENGNESPAIKTVYIGNKSEDSGYYSREVLTIGLSKEESKVVRLVDDFTAESIMGIDPLDYIYMNVAYVLLDDIKDSSIVFSTADKEYKIEYNDVVEGEKTKEVYKLNGEVIDTTSFKDFYYNFTSLRPERVIHDAASIKDGDLVYKIVAHRIKDDYFGEMTLEFRVYDNTYYQVTLNDVTDILVNRRHADNLFKEIEEIKKAE